MHLFPPLWLETHASDITVDSGGHLVIANEAMKQRLLQQINASTVLKQTMMNDRARAGKNQHNASGCNRDEALRLVAAREQRSECPQSRVFGKFS